MNHILVIDDEEVIALMITHALTKFGFDIAIAADGIEGLKKFEEGDFDLVITDIRMPGLDGNSLSRHIRRSNKKLTPIIGISGTPWLLMDRNFDAVLSKPFSIKTLVDTVKNLTAESYNMAATG